MEGERGFRYSKAYDAASSASAAPEPIDQVVVASRSGSSSRCGRSTSRKRRLFIQLCDELLRKASSSALAG